MSLVTVCLIDGDFSRGAVGPNPNRKTPLHEFGVHKWVCFTQTYWHNSIEIDCTVQSVICKEPDRVSYGRQVYHSASFAGCSKEPHQHPPSCPCTTSRMSRGCTSEEVDIDSKQTHDICTVTVLKDLFAIQFHIMLYIILEVPYMTEYM